jgi:peptide/nickel transport system permease protein
MRSWDYIYSTLFSKRTAKAGVVIILCFVLLMALGPAIYRKSPTRTTSLTNSPPSTSHPFGTDFLGRDVLAELIWGSYPSIFVSVSAAIGAVIIGLMFGVISGYFGRIEPLFTGAADIILAFPGIPLLLLIGSLFTINDAIVALLLILVLWAPVARTIRSSVLSVRERPFVEAAKTSGMGNWQVIRRVIIPQVAPIAIAYFVIVVAIAIVMVTSLEFLGVGSPNEISWGSMLYWAQEYAFFTGTWWSVVVPGLAVALVAAGFALIGFSLEEISDPRLNV